MKLNDSKNYKMIIKSNLPRPNTTFTKFQPINNRGLFSDRFSTLARYAGNQFAESKGSMSKVITAAQPPAITPNLGLQREAQLEMER